MGETAGYVLYFFVIKLRSEKKSGKRQNFKIMCLTSLTFFAKLKKRNLQQQYPLIVHELIASFVSTSGTKPDMVFQYPRIVCFLEKCARQSESVAFFINSCVLQTRTDHRGQATRMNFYYFHIHKRMPKTGRVRKVDEKDRIICLIFIFLPEIMCQIMFCFSQFCADSSKKSGKKHGNQKNNLSSSLFLSSNCL